MSELYDSVVRHLRNQREPETALKLWERLWAAYQKGGRDGLEADLDDLVEFPAAGDQEDDS